MKSIACLAAICGLAAGSAAAATIEYRLSGTMLLASGTGAGGFNGASLTLKAQFDDGGVYIERFGLPTVDGGPGSITISGATYDIDNTTTNTSESVGFYPTFAGAFSSPGGTYLTFYSGSGQLFELRCGTTPTPGAGNAVIDGAIELDDFAPGASYAGGGLSDYGDGSSYALTDVEITATIVPAPPAMALVGYGVLVAGRRRR